MAAGHVWVQALLRRRLKACRGRSVQTLLTHILSRVHSSHTVCFITRTLDYLSEVRDDVYSAAFGETLRSCCSVRSENRAGVAAGLPHQTTTGSDSLRF